MNTRIHRPTRRARPFVLRPIGESRLWRLLCAAACESLVAARAPEATVSVCERCAGQAQARRIAARSARTWRTSTVFAAVERAPVDGCASRRREPESRRIGLHASERCRASFRSSCSSGGALLAHEAARRSTWRGSSAASGPSSARCCGRSSGLIYRVCGVDPSVEQRWTAYAVGDAAVQPGRRCCCSTRSSGCRASCPSTRRGSGRSRPDLAFNTAVSFTTNTNWQTYVRRDRR